MEQGQANTPPDHPQRRLYNPVPAPAADRRARGTRQRRGEPPAQRGHLADCHGFLDGRLVTLGLRGQTMDWNWGFNVTTGASTSQYKGQQHPTAGGGGLQTRQNTSIYANCTGRPFLCGSRNSIEQYPPYDNRRNHFRPSSPKQIEVGVKVDWGRIDAGRHHQNQTAQRLRYAVRR